MVMPRLISQFAEHCRCDAGILVWQIHAGTDREIGPQFPTSGVEGRACHLRCPVKGCHTKGPLMPEHEVEQAIVGNLHSLRLACSSRRYK